VSEPDDHSDADHVPDDALPPKPGREKAMGFWDHLEELRWTIIKSAVVFVAFAILIAYWLPEFNGILMHPLTQVKKEYPDVVIQLTTIRVMESIGVLVQICVVGGLALAAPFILFFIGQFVSPALTEKELKAVLPMCVAAAGLFVAGASFSYFILVPSTLRVSIEMNRLLEFGFNWTADSYYMLLVLLTGGVGLSFEFPLLIVLLVWMGVLSVAFLRKYRRHAIVVIFILAAVITPTQDPINLTLFAIPLYILYEAAIIASARVEKRRAKQLEL
jgi:sec-independent protein translocase protein TatC